MLCMYSIQYNTTYCVQYIIDLNVIEVVRLPKSVTTFQLTRTTKVIARPRSRALKVKWPDGIHKSMRSKRVTTEVRSVVKIEKYSNTQLHLANIQKLLARLSASQRVLITTHMLPCSCRPLTE